jgi:hypothetical protein
MVTDPDPASVTLNNGFTVTAAAGAQSLLSGCTYIGSGGCSLPSGWQLVAQQDFECSGSHSSPANPSCGTLPSSQYTSVSRVTNTFEKTQVHNGSYAFGGQYTSDGDQVDWGIAPGSGTGQMGSFNTVYVSWWEYTDSNAQYGNSDYFMFYVLNTTPCDASGLYSGTQYDAQPNISSSTSPLSNALMLVAGTANPQTTCQGMFQYGNGARNLPMMAGTWRQVEVLYTPSTSVTGSALLSNTVTCTSSSVPGCGNGLQQLWINGQPNQQETNANLNGTNSMANAQVQIGGVITDYCDMAETIHAAPFSVCPAAAPTAFHRYFDDIIVMKK